MSMSKAPANMDKIKKSVSKPTGEKSGTAAFSQKGKQKDLNWKKPNAQK